MNPDNFMVRGNLRHVERFKSADAWQTLTDADIHEIENHIAGLPSQIETDEIEARFFDLSALRMQIAVVEIGWQAAFSGQTRSLSSVWPVNSLLPAQTSAQRDGGWPGAPRAHCGLAVVPVGTLVGHGAVAEHAGQHISPGTPVIWTLFSPVSQGPV